MPKLYVADALALPKKPYRTVKGARSHKAEPAAEAPAAAVVDAAAAPVKRARRPMTDEEKERMKENRRVKKDARLASEAQTVAAAAERDAAVAAKKAAAALKRKATLEAKKKAQHSVDLATAGATSPPAVPKPAPKQRKRKPATDATPVVDRPPSDAEPVVKKARKRATAEPGTTTPPPSSTGGSADGDGKTPPPWFNTIVELIEREKAEQNGERVNKRDLKAKATRTAGVRWADGLTRDRVQGAVDSHVSKMYEMIFS